MSSDKLFHGGWNGKSKLDSKNPYFTHNRVPDWLLRQLGFESIEKLREYILSDIKIQKQKTQTIILKLFKALKSMEFQINWYIDSIITINNGFRVIFKTEWDDLSEIQKDKEVNEFFHYFQEFVVRYKDVLILGNKDAKLTNSKGMLLFEFLIKNGGFN